MNETISRSRALRTKSKRTDALADRSEWIVEVLKERPLFQSLLFQLESHAEEALHREKTALHELDMVVAELRECVLSIPGIVLKDWKQVFPDTSRIYRHLNAIQNLARFIELRIQKSKT